MVCYNNERMGPCAVCLKIGSYNLLSDDGRWIVGYLCDEHFKCGPQSVARKFREEFLTNGQS